MKISTFRVPCKIRRDEQGHISIETFESKKELVAEERIPDSQSNEIPKLAVSLSQENDRARTILKATLLKNQKESVVDSFLTMKILS